MRFLYIDFESQSDADIRLGPTAYWRHPSTRPTCMAWALDDGPVNLWLPGDRRPTFPSSALLNDPGVILVAHNVAFDHAGLCAVGHDVPFRRWEDTSAIARVYGLPAKLGALASGPSFGFSDKLYADDDKRRAGLRRTFKPGGRATDEHWADLYAYCKHDVSIMRQVHREFMRREWGLKNGERQTWLDTLERNRRGVPVDLKLLPRAVALVEQFAKEKEEEFQARVGCSPRSPFLKDRYGLPNMRKETVAAALAGDKLTPEQRDELQLRALVVQSAVAKIPAMLKRADPKTSLVHDTAVYHGAHTGRDTSVGLQLHNLKRTSINEDAIENLRALIHSGDILKEEDPLALFASFVRPLIFHPTRKLIVGDFGQIEARITAFLAGNKLLLDAFARGEDAYKVMASRLFKVPVGSITKQQRAVGKEVVLACGFGMGPVKFRARMKAQGAAMTFREACEVILDYRLADDHRMNNFWAAVTHAATSQGRDPHPSWVPFLDRLHRLGVSYRQGRGRIATRLPSGRESHYWRVHHAEAKSQFTDEQRLFIRLLMERQGGGSFDVNHKKLVPFYVNPHGRHVQLRRTILVENLVQAIARDVMVLAVKNLQAVGFDVRFTVHDEIVSLLTPQQMQDEEATTRLYQETMTRTLPWPGWETLPIRADVGVPSHRYHK